MHRAWLAELAQISASRQPSVAQSEGPDQVDGVLLLLNVIIEHHVTPCVQGTA